MGKNIRLSIVALHSVDGVHQQFKELLKLADESGTPQFHVDRRRFFPERSCFPEPSWEERSFFSGSFFGPLLGTGWYW